MKKILLRTICIVFTLTACDGWSYTVPTFPAPPPTITPSIFSPTPVIVTITNTTTPATVPETPTETSSAASPATPTDSALPLPKPPPPPRRQLCRPFPRTSSWEC